MLEIEKQCEYARYSENLENVVNKIGGVKILRLVYESYYQGDVDIDVLLQDGRVFSYHYYYGSCSGCDEWEDLELTECEIEERMLDESTMFDDISQYEEWLIRRDDKC